jgi:hypothetical protein
MRTVLALPLIVGLGVGLVACGGSAQPPPTPANTLDLQTGVFDVPPGDSFQCIYTSTTTDAQMFVGNATAKQGPGGHHVTVYYTSSPQAPTSHPCTNEEMAGWNEIAGATNGGEPVIPLPAGGAISVPAGVQIVVQAHYINTTGTTFQTNDTVSVDIIDAKDVAQIINMWVMPDLGFTVPPAASGKSVTTCTVDKDVQTVTLLGHMHEFGKHYSLERIDGQGNSLEMVYQQDWQALYASHPPLVTGTLAAPVVLQGGTILRQTCEWDNTSPNPLTFPREMCVAVAYYFPDRGFLQCDAQPAQ